MPVKFDCPKCGQRIGVADDLVGSAGSCPRCGAEIVVPSPSPDVTLPLIRPPKRTPTECGFKMKEGRRPPSRRQYSQRLGSPGLPAMLGWIIAVLSLAVGAGLWVLHGGQEGVRKTGASAPATPSNGPRSGGVPTHEGKPVSERAAVESSSEQPQSQGLRLVLMANPEDAEKIQQNPDLVRRIKEAYQAVQGEQGNLFAAIQRLAERAERADGQIGALKLNSMQDKVQLLSLQSERDGCLERIAGIERCLGKLIYFKALGLSAPPGK